MVPPSRLPTLLPCGYCDETFVDHPDLIVHVETAHTEEEEEGDDDGDKQEEKEEVRHRCEPCGETFLTEGRLQEHISENHRELRPWRCRVCSKTFPFKTRLLHHEEIHKRPEDRERRYGCNDCDKRFLRSGDLWAHKRIHSGTTYPCPTCGKRLSSSGAFHNHVSTHSKGERGFRCDVCGKEFATRQKHVVHQMQHEGRKPFSCRLPGCEEGKKGFVHKQSLEAHVRRCHDGTAIHCHVCRKPFNDRSYLNKHLRWHDTVEKEKKKKKVQA